MMLVKIMDKLREKSAVISTEEGNKKNIIEENIKKINGKEGDELKQENLKLYPEVFTGIGRLESPYQIQFGRECNSSYPCTLEDSSITEE